MPKSMMSRYIKQWKRMIFSEADLYPADYQGPVRFDAMGGYAPPYKVGRQFPYENQRRKREDAALDRLAEFDGQVWKALESLDKPYPKSPEQMQIEARYLGRDRHTIPKKRSTRSLRPDSNPTVRRSSKRKAFRPVLIES